MLKKLRFMKADAYQAYVAASYLAEMIAARLDGRPHPSGYARIGAEQGPAEWDDLVIESDTGGLEHHQVKRQEVAFSTDALLRDRISKGDREGVLKDLSPLDKVFKRLGVLVLDELVPRAFVLDVMYPTTEIKKGLEIRHLQDATQTCQKAGVTAAGLTGSTDAKLADVLRWLQSWCEFEDAGHVLKALRVLRVQTSFDEAKLHAQMESVLAPYVTNPAKAANALRHFVLDNQSHEGALDANIALAQILEYRRPGLATWTRYSARDRPGTWRIDGIASDGPDEPPDLVASAASENGHRIYVDAPAPSRLDGRPLTGALVKLMLHMERPVMAREGQGWTELARQSVGGTLGDQPLSQDNPRVETWAAENTSVSGVDCCAQESRIHAEGLVRALDARTWAVCRDLVWEQILSWPEPTVQEHLSEVWTRWEAQLETTPGEYLAPMLRLHLEPNNVSGSLRLGRRVLRLLADGLVLRLLVEVGLDGDGDFARRDGKEVRTVALRYYFDPGTSAAVKVDDLADASDVLGKEVADLIILSGVECSPADLLGESFALDASHQHALASTRTPTVFTNHRQLRNAGRHGLEELSTYVAHRVHPRRRAREQRITDMGS